VPVGLIGFALALLPAVGADDKNEDKGKSAKSTGMIVVKDAETGQLRAPTAEEAAVLTNTNAKSQTKGPAPQPTTFVTGGGVGLVLDESTTVFAVAKKNPDGTVTIGEATGPDAAKAAAAPKPNGKSNPSSAKGAANDR